MRIKNVVFDIGNVIVRWSPQEIVELTFGKQNSPQARANDIFQSDVWLNLNKGQLTETEAAAEYQALFGWSQTECDQFFYYVKASQILIYGTINLIHRIKNAGYQVYALTDNVHEIVSHLKTTYDFWNLFDGATVSAEKGLLKPHAAIYNALLTDYNIKASETVFTDDMSHNVQGAELVGIRGIQFQNSEQCEHDLKALGLRF